MRHIACSLLLWVSTLELVSGYTYNFSQVSGSPAIVDLRDTLLDPLQRLTEALGVENGSYYGTSGILGYYLPYLTSIYGTLSNISADVNDSEGILADVLDELELILQSEQAQEASASNLLNAHTGTFDTSSVEYLLNYAGYPVGANDYGSGNWVLQSNYGSLNSMANMANNIELQEQTSKLDELVTSGEDTQEKLEEVCECIDMVVATSTATNTELINIKAELISNGSANTAELQLICQKIVELNANIALQIQATVGDPTDENGDPIEDPEEPSLDTVTLPTKDDPTLATPGAFSFTSPFDWSMASTPIPSHPVGWGGLTLDLEGTMAGTPELQTLRNMFTAFLVVGIAMFFFMRWGRHFSM